MGNVFLDERARFIARIQELAVVLVAAWALVAAGYSIRTGALTLIHPAYSYPLLLVFYQWISTMGIHVRLRDRELLLSALVGLEGESLLHALRDSSLQAGLSLKSLRMVVLMVSAHQVIAFAVFAAASLIGAPVSASGYILCGLHAAFASAVSGMVRVFSENQILLGEGVVVTGGMEFRRFLAVFGIVSGAVPAAVLISRDSSTLPISWILELLERLARLLSLRLGDGATQRLQRLLQDRSGYGDRFTSAFSGGNLGLWSYLIGEIFRRVLATAAVIVLYFFVVSPLLSEEFRAALARRNPLAFLIDKLKEFARFILGLGRRFRDWLSWRKRGDRSWRREGQDQRAASLGADLRDELPLRKRIQAGRVLRAFLRLMRWAEHRGVGYRVHETLQEYGGRLHPIVPDRGLEVSLIVDVLEEALFSAHLVSADRVSRYFTAIREVRKTAA
jgi:hypothetical protein